MKIGLIDVDGHNFPNLALMRISAYHKARGDSVEWWWSDFEYFDIVYKSKVFSDVYSKDVPDPFNCGKVIRGGTGYQIQLVNGKEIYDKTTDRQLPPEVERMFPDYSIYPQFDFAVSMTSRGCPRGCSFCHVAAKEGRCSVKVADVSDFWNGQKEIKVLDPNITACQDCVELLHQYAETGARCDFTQGIDARMLTPEKIDAFNRCKIKMLHFAWDDMKQSGSVLRGLKLYSDMGAVQDPRKRRVYVLTNYDTTQEQNLYRIYTLRELGYDPYVMVYNKPSAPKEIRELQRYVNNKFIFRSCERFEDYKNDRQEQRWEEHTAQQNIFVEEELKKLKRKEGQGNEFI